MNEKKKEIEKLEVAHKKLRAELRLVRLALVAVKRRNRSLSVVNDAFLKQTEVCGKCTAIANKIKAINSELAKENFVTLKIVKRKPRKSLDTTFRNGLISVDGYRRSIVRENTA